MKKIFTFIACLLALSIQAKNYKGAEIYSRQSYLYGKFEMKIKAAKGSGQLSTFFLYRNSSELSSTLWEEIDIEIFGKKTTEFQTNVIIEKQEGTKLTTEKHHAMAFDLAEDFHTFVVEWTPDSICWYVDDVLLRTEKEYAQFCKDPMSIRFNHWAASISSWVGSFDTSVLPSYQYVDYLSYYSYDTTATDPESRFILEWEDDFSTFNTSRWSKANWTFGDNLCDFYPANAYSEDGMLVLKLHDINPPQPTMIGSSEKTLLYPNPFKFTPKLNMSADEIVKFRVSSIQGYCIFESIDENELLDFLENIPAGNYMLQCEYFNKKNDYQIFTKF